MVWELKSRGFYIRALARSPEKLEPLKDLVDETFIGQVTELETLTGIAHGMDAVFSSVGITRQTDKLTFRDVDFQGNMNLLDEAKKAGVKKFIYISIFKGAELRRLAIIKAHEDFVDELKVSGLKYAVVRPTGYFSDMEEFFRMAQKGRVFLFGDGRRKLNPIHGADLAKVCADAVLGEENEIDAGGPEVLTHEDIAKTAFSALNRPVKITRIPVRVMKALIKMIRPFARHQSDLMDFFTTAGSMDVVAPAFGDHTLGEHYKNLAEAEKAG